MKNVYNAMRVLSLFDGMSCGQIALKEIGITPEVYYVSEIDKFAIKQTQLNFPNTIQVGDVRDLNVEDLGHIDLILAGSPCKDMSFSGKRKGLSTVEGIEIKSIVYKANLLGIEVITHEESYTSKIDHLAFEPLKKQESYLGKRKKRGLFQSSVGKLINADINGAIGIARKVVGDSFIGKIIDSGFVFNPVRINIL